jgi:glyoxylase-like metal-dependent hydrolase (beta-lactamase superfamily II)
VFTGDHVINGDGALVEHVPEYLESLDHLNACGPRVIFPGHGNPMRDPAAVISSQAAAIRDREGRILAALGAGAATVGEVVERVYPGLDRALYFSAAENIGAHLRKLSGDGRVALPEGAVEWSAQVSLVSSGREDV